MSQPNPIPPPTAHTDTKKKPKTEFQLRLESFQSFIDQPRVTDQLARVLPDNMEVKRQKVLLINSLRRTPKVLLATRESLVAAVVQTFELGLSPVPALGHAYFVPFETKGRLLCQLIIGYRGLIELARRSGLVASIRAEVVRRGDYFRYTLGLTPTLEHVPSDVLEFESQDKRLAVMHALGGMAPDGKLIAAYSVVSLKDGTKEFRVVTQEFINRIKKASRGSNHPDSPWQNWPDQMWAKTAIRQTLKFVPLSPEDRLLKGLEIDETAFTDIGKPIIETTAVAVSESNGSSEMSSIDEGLSVESESNAEQTGMDAFVHQQQAPANNPVETDESAAPEPEADKPATDKPSEPTADAPRAQRRRRSPT
jgi:recombination protein RecT